jgi:hypothetical protein
MIENLPFALLVCDASTLKIVEHNAAASIFFGRILSPSSDPSRVLVGHDASDFFPDFAATLEPLLRRAVLTEEACFADEIHLPARAAPSASSRSP